MEKGYYVPEDFFTPPDGVRQLDLFRDIADERRSDAADEFLISSAFDIAKVMDSMIVEGIANEMDRMILAACIPVALLAETEKP